MDFAQILAPWQPEQASPASLNGKKGLRNPWGLGRKPLDLVQGRLDDLAGGQAHKAAAWALQTLVAERAG